MTYRDTPYDPEVDPMPVFPLKGKDLHTIETVKFYKNLLIMNGEFDQAREVDKALDELYGWSDRNPDQMKLPDHKHVDAKHNKD